MATVLAMKSDEGRGGEGEQKGPRCNMHMDQFPVKTALCILDILMKKWEKSDTLNHI